MGGEEEERTPVSITSLDAAISLAISQSAVNNPRQCLSNERLCHGLQVSDDLLTVTHTLNPQSHTANTDASIQTRHPLSYTFGVGYYEAKVTHCNPDAGVVVAIGLAEAGYSNTKQPGWKRNSCGYHSDEGCKYHNNGVGEKYGPKFSTGDVVGCGYHQRKRLVWFTLNGRMLGTAFRFPSDDSVFDIYPTIGVRQATVSLCFIPQNWMFDISAIHKHEREVLLSSVAGHELPDPTVVPHLISSYLLHHGYTRTFNTFSQAAHLSSNKRYLKQVGKSQPHAKERTGFLRRNPKPAADSSDNDVVLSRLSEREELISCILQGDISKALTMIDAKFPKLFVVRPEVRMVLLSQQFIELVKADRLQEAMQLAKSSAGRTGDDGLHPTMRKVMGLLAYKDPYNSPLSHLLGQKQRGKTADAVNSAALVCLSYEDKPPLEKLLQHLVLLTRLVSLDTRGCSSPRGTGDDLFRPDP